MLDCLRRLCEVPAVSGREDQLAETILREISPFAECTRDNLGNIRAFKAGRNRPKLKVMLDAHMDEVGLIITNVNDDGYLLFDTVGGIDPSVIFGTRVRIGETVGVIASTPVHLLSEDERLKTPKSDQLVIDIGANSKEDALAVIHIGDVAVFDVSFSEFGQGLVKSRALDDRAGCAVLIELIKRELPCDMYFCFTVQEEVGLRGAQTSAFHIAPDAAIVVEATFAADVPGIPAEQQVCRLGGGTAVSFMDNGTVYDRELYDLAFTVAKENGLSAQPKAVAAGGNNSGAIHTALGGVRTVALSVPCRYIHSQRSVISLNDLQNTAELTFHLASRMAALTIDH